MSDLMVTNPNILVDAHQAQGRRRAAILPGDDSDRNGAALRRVRLFRQEIEEVVCSATWVEDCLYRGAEYPPDFRCACRVCRELFPSRLHPRPVRESRYSLDCQVETDEDPEFAEDFRRLRNERPRHGSVYIAHWLKDAGAKYAL